MSTEHYGYIVNPPDVKPEDECHCWGKWQTRIKSNHVHNGKSIESCGTVRRPIQPGEGYRMLGLDEKMPDEWEFQQDKLPNLGWVRGFGLGYSGTTREYVEQFHVLAIRVPIEQENRKVGDDHVASGYRTAEVKAPEETNGAKEFMPIKQEDYQCPACNDFPHRPRFCGEWVSVKDELPIEAGEYLILTDHGTFYKCNYRRIEFLRYDRSTIRDITHWLRLYPQPPLPEVKEDECRYQYQVAVRSLQHEVDYDSFKAGWHAAKKGDGE